MSTQETSIVPFKANEQPFEFVHPGKGAFGTETAFIDICIEKALPPSLGLLAITQVLWNIGN